MNTHQSMAPNTTVISGAATTLTSVNDLITRLQGDTRGPVRGAFGGTTHSKRQRGHKDWRICKHRILDLKGERRRKEEARARQG